MARYIVTHKTSGDTYVTDERSMSDSLHWSEYMNESGPLPELDLFDFELDPEQPWAPDKADEFRYELAQESPR